MASSRKTSKSQLFLTVLSIIAYMSGISGLSTHGDGERRPNTLAVASSGVSSVRNLKHGANMDQSREHEDRFFEGTVLAEFINSLKDKLVKHVRIFILDPELSFKSLNLHHRNDELFGSSEFEWWLSNARKVYPSEGNKVFKVLSTHYKQETLAIFLLRALKVPEQREMAVGIYHDLLKFWSHEEYTLDQALNVLKPESIKDASIESFDVMFPWIGYVEQQAGKGWKKVYRKEMVKFLVRQSKAENLNDQLSTDLAKKILERYQNTFKPLVESK